MALDTTKFTGTLSAQDLGTEFFDELIQSSTVFSLGRSIGTISSGKATITVPSQLISASFVGVGEDKPVTEGDLAVKELNAGKLAAIILVPTEVIDDSNIDILNDYIKRYAPEAFGAALDAAVLFGKDAPANWTGIQEGLVTQATAKGNVVTQTDDAYKDILGKTGIVTLVNDDGFRVTGFAGDPSYEGELREALDKAGRPLYQPYLNPISGKHEEAIYGKPYHTAFNGAWDATQALLVGGDFSKLIYAMRQDLTYSVSSEASVKLADGTTVNCFQQNVVAFRMEMRIAAGVLNPVTRKNTDEGTRFPFAVIKPSA